MIKTYKIILLIGFLFISIQAKTQADSVITETNENIIASDTIKKERKKIFSKNKKSPESKPEKITGETWKKKSLEQKDSLLLAWSEYDIKHYRQKFEASEFQKSKMRKADKNFFDKIIATHAEKKPSKYRKKLINCKNARFKKTLKYDRPKNYSDEEWDLLSPEQRMEYIVRKNRYEGQKEAVRKNKIVNKFDKKEDKINRKYALSNEEKMLLNKGSGMHLRGTEQLIYNRAKTKIEKHTYEITELRKKRQFEIQNIEVQKRMKQNKKETEKKYGQISDDIRKREKIAAKNEKKRLKQLNKKRK